MRKPWKGVPTDPAETKGVAQFAYSPAQFTATPNAHDVPLLDPGKGRGYGNARPPRSDLAGVGYGAAADVPEGHRHTRNLAVCNPDGGMFLARATAVEASQPNEGWHMGLLACAWPGTPVQQLTQSAVAENAGKPAPDGGHYGYLPGTHMPAYQQFAEDDDRTPESHEVKRPSMAVPLAVVAIGALVAVALLYDMRRNG